MKLVIPVVIVLSLLGLALLEDKPVNKTYSSACEQHAQDVLSGHYDFEASVEVKQCSRKYIQNLMEK